MANIVLTEEQLQEMINRAAKKAVTEYSEKHACKLTEAERHMVHAQHTIMEEEGADTGVIRIIFQYGVTMKDITKKVRTFILIILGLVILAVAGKAIF